MVWVRVLVGAVWVNGGLEKLLNPDFPQQFAQSLGAGGFVSGAPPFFQAFMLNNIVPNAGAVAQLVRFAELGMGLALIVGLLTNFAALGSLVLSMMILLSQGGVRFGTGLGAPEFLNINLLLALLSVIVLASAAAKESSFDEGIAGRRPGLSALLTNRRSGHRSGYRSGHSTGTRRYR
ncbi:MAG: DoxX family protein [Rubrobacter sp.]